MMHLRAHHYTQVQRQKAEDDDSWASVLSDDEDDDFTDENVVAAADLSFQHQWERLTRKFAARDTIIKQIAQGKSQMFVDMLHEEEQQVREKQREQLLRRVLFHRQNKVEIATYDKDHKASSSEEDYDELIKEISNSCQPQKTSLSFYQNLRNWFSFEMYATTPAVLSLLLHTFAHAAIYDITEYLIHRVRKYFTVNETSIEDALAMAVLMLGVMLLRLSGVLYWWNNARDYQYIKYAYQNRLRLNMIDARCILWVRRRDKVRATCYIFGYYLVYCAVLHGQLRVKQLFDRRFELLGDLPSTKYDQHVCLPTSPPEVKDSGYSFDCQQQLELVETRNEELVDADASYTWYVASRMYALGARGCI